MICIYSTLYYLGLFVSVFSEILRTLLIFSKPVVTSSISAINGGLVSILSRVLSWHTAIVSAQEDDLRQDNLKPTVGMLFSMN
jgi:hypothetical protein